MNQADKPKPHEFTPIPVAPSHCQCCGWLEKEPWHRPTGPDTDGERPSVLLCTTGLGLYELRCDVCGQIDTTDEDGCCATCGGDTNYATLSALPLHQPASPQPEGRGPGISPGFQQDPPQSLPPEALLSARAIGLVVQKLPDNKSVEVTLEGPTGEAYQRVAKAQAEHTAAFKDAHSVHWHNEWLKEIRLKDKAYNRINELKAKVDAAEAATMKAEQLGSEVSMDWMFAMEKVEKAHDAAQAQVARLTAAAEHMVKFSMRNMGAEVARMELEDALKPEPDAEIHEGNLS